MSVVDGQMRRIERLSAVETGEAVEKGVRCIFPHLDIFTRLVELEHPGLHNVCLSILILQPFGVYNYPWLNTHTRHTILRHMNELRLPLQVLG